VAETRIPVDLLNPGQVFACLGLLEAAEVLCGEAEGGFDWSDQAAVRFVLRAAGEGNPVAKVMEFLSEASVFSVSPLHSGLSTTKPWSVPTRQAADETFPFPAPNSPATLPALLEDTKGRQIQIEYWGDATCRDAVKFWAGSGGYPGAALARDALELIRHAATSAVEDPFAVSAPQSSSFRLDWRRDYVPVELGFSLNEHTSTMTMMGFPLVELLAAIGLQNARPLRLDRLSYRYAVLGTCVPPLLFRPALGCAPLPFPGMARSFRMRLGWPGQEGQARCIIDVIEDSTP